MGTDLDYCDTEWFALEMNRDHSVIFEISQRLHFRLLLTMIATPFALNMQANLESSAVATGLEKVSFHSNPKERQCQRMLKLPHNCTHLTC